jgi:uncharacterized protein (TIGR02246 family)
MTTEPADSSAYFASLATMIQGFNDHDVEAVAAVLNESCVISRGDGASLPGGDTLTGWLHALFAACPDAAIEIGQIVALPGDMMLAEWRITGTSLGGIEGDGEQPAIPANGGHIDAGGAALLTFDADAQISRIEARGDAATLLGQLGVYALPERDADQVNDLATRYAAAWCAQDAGAVAALFSEHGTLSDNGGAPATGQEEIETVVQGFMDAFSELELVQDDLLIAPEAVVFNWRLKGTNTETGKKVHIGGLEIWQVDADGLITTASDYYDTAVYEEQVQNGAAA